MAQECQKLASRAHANRAGGLQLRQLNLKLDQIDVIQGSADNLTRDRAVLIGPINIDTGRK